MCYFLLMINQTANVATPSRAEVQAAWNTLNCTIQLGCGYKDTFMPGTLPKEYIAPNVCGQTTGMELFSRRRWKAHICQNVTKIWICPVYIFRHFRNTKA